MAENAKNESVNVATATSTVTFNIVDVKGYNDGSITVVTDVPVRGYTRQEDGSYIEDVDKHELSVGVRDLLCLLRKNERIEPLLRMIGAKRHGYIPARLCVGFVVGLELTINQTHKSEGETWTDADGVVNTLDRDKWFTELVAVKIAKRTFGDMVTVYQCSEFIQ